MNPIDEYRSVNSLSVLKFSGADTINFLQGQLTNDINALESAWQFSGYCNPKGRLLALFHLWRHNDDIYTTIDSSLVEATIKRLRMYVMRANVVIEELHQASCLYLIDPKNQAKRFSVDLDGDKHTLEFGGRSLLVDLSGSNNSASDETSASDWELACISAGEPTINSTNVELFVPQMVNLDLLDGINFKKGCYTGQEIVARMHYLGKLKQRMYLCSTNGDTRPGEKINVNDKNAGNIVAASSGAALAVIRREYLPEQLSTELGVQLTPESQQPYSIPE